MSVFGLWGAENREGRAERKSGLSHFCDAGLTYRRIRRTLMVDQKIIIFLTNVNALYIISLIMSDNI